MARRRPAFGASTGQAYSVLCPAESLPSTNVQLDNADLEIRPAVRDSTEEPFVKPGAGARGKVAV